MSISFEEIRKLARLSKLQISTENECLVKERLENVLALVDQLQEAETKNTHVESSRTDYSQRLRSDKEVRAVNRIELKIVHPKSLKGSIKYQELSIKTFNMKELSISALNQSLKNKDFTSVELTEYFLKESKNIIKISML